MTEEEECTPVTLPSMGEGVYEANLVRWLKKEGDTVDEGEALLEVSTDKVDTEIPAPKSGYLRQPVGINQTIRVEQVIAYISPQVDTPIPTTHAPEPTESLPHQARPEEVTAGSQQPGLPSTWAGRVRSSPLVRKLAKATGVDLHRVPSSGYGGRVTKGDLEAYLRSGSNSTVTESHSLKTEIKEDGREYLDGVAVKREQMSQQRVLIAEHMLRSVQTSPHASTCFEVDLTAAQEYKQEAAERFSKEYDSKLTLTPFFIHAAVQAIKQSPEFNVAIDGKEVLHRETIDVGCAVALERNLLVPVLKDVADWDLFTLANNLNILVKRCKNKQLTAKEFAGSGFTVTNPGMYGCLHSQAIINQPQVAIMSVGALSERLQLQGEQLSTRVYSQVGLTFDHRWIDGWTAAKFLGQVREVLHSY